MRHRSKARASGRWSALILLFASCAPAGPVRAKTLPYEASGSKQLAKVRARLQSLSSGLESDGFRITSRSHNSGSRTWDLSGSHGDLRDLRVAIDILDNWKPGTDVATVSVSAHLPASKALLDFSDIENHLRGALYGR